MLAARGPGQPARPALGAALGENDPVKAVARKCRVHVGLGQFPRVSKRGSRKRGQG